VEPTESESVAQIPMDVEESDVNIGGEGEPPMEMPET